MGMIVCEIFFRDELDDRRRADLLRGNGILPLFSSACGRWTQRDKLDVFRMELYIRPRYERVAKHDSSQKAEERQLPAFCLSHTSVKIWFSIMSALEACDLYLKWRLAPAPQAAKVTLSVFVYPPSKNGTTLLFQKKGVIGI